MKPATSFAFYDPFLFVFFQFSSVLYNCVIENSKHIKMVLNGKHYSVF